MDEETKQIMRRVPSVDALLKAPEMEALAADFGHKLVADAVREALGEFRQQLRTGAMAEVDDATIRARALTVAAQRLAETARPFYRRVVNAAGIVLHTGLGRAVLPQAAIRQITQELQGYSLLQLSAETGKRSRRDERIDWLLQRLTGAEAATVVNNNAAATAIVLNTVGKDKEVIVSRGQLVEIGGSFRLPEVMAFSGAKLV